MVELNCLPDEILVEIFTRLPIKSLILCACTSKWLLNFVTSSSFMNAQIKINAQNPFLFLRYFSISTQKEYYSLQPDNDTFNGEFNLVDMPIRCPGVDVNTCCLNVVGSCNGLICLTDDHVICPNIILWNPCIRKRLIVPRPVNVITYDGYYDNELLKGWYGFDCSKDGFPGVVSVALGFGFDCLTNDFKVVRLVYCERFSQKIEVPPYVDVYTVSSGSWRALEASGPMYYVCKPEYSQCFVNGFVHWPGWSDSVWSVIVTFNMQEEVFGEINLPVCLANGDDRYSADLKVRNCRDMLALATMSHRSKSYSVWVMREYGAVESWSKTFKLEVPDGYPSPKTLGFRKNEEILVFVTNEFFHDCRHIMLLVDSNGLVVNVLGMIDGKSGSFCLDTYVESLALLKGGSLILESNS